MNAIFPSTLAAAVELFLIVRKNDKKNQYSELYVNSNFKLWLKILKMGAITFFGECSHWNRDRKNILFRSH